ncbi:hypothetical protein AORI_6843 [Amycolatopsis keratiniphila]|uniref:Uncharacterized protein n=1 Tax=Amycolatopsis keratiniphila TaxID=129921 RepID=R4T3P0_9PSEU|nr:hypothetical protein AORI_6843 [Amycolatopsis keratiniphila]
MDVAGRGDPGQPDHLPSSFRIRAAPGSGHEKGRPVGRPGGALVWFSAGLRGRRRAATTGRSARAWRRSYRSPESRGGSLIPGTRRQHFISAGAVRPSYWRSGFTFDSCLSSC